jgi:hypothetical protein
MATEYKILGQSAPSATTETVLYTAPTETSAVVSTLAVCNQSPLPATFRIAVRPSSDSTTAAKHWIVFGATVDGSDSTMLTLGVTVSAGDTVRVFSSSATMSFSLFGSEII